MGGFKSVEDGAPDTMVIFDNSSSNKLPERATRSVKVRPFEANIAFSLFKLKSACGRRCLTLAFVEILPSSLPSSTLYDGPPVCTQVNQCSFGFQPTCTTHHNGSILYGQSVLIKLLKRLFYNKYQKRG